MSYENFSLAAATDVVSSLFPCTISLRTPNGDEVMATRFVTSSAERDTVSVCLRLLQTTIGKLYTIHKGPNWMKDKIVEMLEEDLVYISYKTGDRCIAFISFVLSTDKDDLLMYLYEIHVDSEFHGQNVGSVLVGAFHDLATELKNGTVSIDGVDCTQLVGTKLTVFPDNPRALKWYHRMNYALSEDSPKDRTLRSGKVIVPDYYTLERRL